jgi:hypothetical protein
MAGSKRDRDRLEDLEIDAIIFKMMLEDLHGEFIFRIG